VSLTLTVLQFSGFPVIGGLYGLAFVTGLRADRHPLVH